MFDCTYYLGGRKPANLYTNDVASSKCPTSCPRRVRQGLSRRADGDNCPYLESVLMECARYHPVGPMGVPHLSEKDDIVDGKRIPPGSIMFYTVW